MKKFKFLLVLSLIIVIASCNNKKVKNKLQSMEWLLGSWQMNTDKGMLYEEWVKENDSLFSGKSFMAINADTIILEYINLQLANNDLFYIPIVLNQNGEKPVLFKLTDKRENKYVFENKQHDYPQKIVYNQISKDSFNAWVEGNKEGKYIKKDFKMTRSKIRK